MPPSRKALMPMIWSIGSRLCSGSLAMALMRFWMPSIGPMEGIQNRIKAIAKDPLHKRDPMLQIIGIKAFLDGGMLTGSAYMRKPWGVSEIYAIRDPEYRGVLFIPRERLLPIVKTALDNGMQFTAHSVGDG